MSGGVDGVISAAVDLGRYFEFGAGLGDVIVSSLQSEVFTALDDATDDPVAVVLICHNPQVSELFRFHENCRKLVLREIPVSDFRPGEESDTESFRLRHGLPIPRPTRRVHLYENFCPSFTPKDAAFIDTVQAPFVVVSSTASVGPTDKRSLTPRLLSSVVRTILASGLIPVLVGARYSTHEEVPLPEISGVLSAVDRLTVAGSLELIRRAAATVACDSAMGCAARSMWRRTFTLVGDEMWKACSGPAVGHGSLLHPNLYFSSFQAYTDDLLSKFLNSLDIR